MTCYKYSITCQDDLLTVDNAQNHVTAFRPISEAARSWSDDKFAVLMDETTDVAHKEQVAVFVRFVNDACDVEERLLSIVDTAATTGEL